jgi:hypothetical protein
MVGLEVREIRAEPGDRIVAVAITSGGHRRMSKDVMSREA